VSPGPARPELVGLRLSDAPQAWEALGFAVDALAIWLGAVRLELGAPGRGIVGWRLRGVEAVDAIDGLPTEVEEASPPPDGAVGHPNGAIALDHVVVLTPDFERTASALDESGMALKRTREAPEGIRQGFRRLGSAILELVEAPDAVLGPARFWGLVVIVADLDALAERLGDRLGAVKDAVQPGRRIATLRQSGGLAEAVAFMSSEP
jgi:hypothetical protein